MNKLEAFKALGLKESATAKEIKAAYRKASSKHHPDKDGGDEEEFKKSKKAYEVLTGKIKPELNRQEYHAQEQAAWNQAFGEMERRRHAAMANGRDIRSALSIDMITALKGGKIEHKLNLLSGCSSCGGHGFLLKTETSGNHHHIQCTECNGMGQVQQAKTYNITIPANTFFGKTLRLKGKGEQKRAATGIDGDLYITIQFKEDDYYHLINDRIHVVVFISFEIWMLGGAVDVATPKGIVKVKIPAFISETDILAIKGKGIGNTDIYVSVYLDKTGLSADVNADAVRHIMNNIKDSESTSLYADFRRDTIEMADKLKK